MITWGEALVWWTICFAVAVAWGLLILRFPTLQRYSLTTSKRLIEEHRAAMENAEQQVGRRVVRRAQVIAILLTAAAVAVVCVGLMALISWLPL